MGLSGNHKKLKTTIYEEYDGHIHGNQKYTLMLMKALGGNAANSDVELNLVVRQEGALYNEALRYGSVMAARFSNIAIRAIRLVSMMSKQKPDLIVCHNERSVIISSLAAVLTGTPLVWYIKNSRSSVFIDLLASCVSARILAIAPGCLDIKNGFIRKRIMSGKASVLPIGVHLDDFVSIPSPLNSQGPLRILILAAIAYTKGIDIALEALRLLSIDGIRIELKIAGSTPPGSEEYERRMRQLSERLPGCSVQWCGWTSDVVSLLEWSDIVMLPSRSEGSPRSIVEAMASARPVVASDVGGIPYIVVEGETGYMARVNDIAAFADRIRRFHDDRGLISAMGLSARQRAINNYGFEKHLADLIAAWKDAASGKNI